jgi:hypothetical protein
MQLVEALCHKTGGSRFYSWWGFRKFSSGLFLMFAFSNPGNRNQYRGISLEVKCGQPNGPTVIVVPNIRVRWKTNITPYLWALMTSYGEAYFHTTVGRFLASICPVRSWNHSPPNYYCVCSLCAWFDRSPNSVHARTTDSRSFSLRTMCACYCSTCALTGSSISVELHVTTWFFVTGIGHVWAEGMLRKFINLPRSYSNRTWWQISAWAMPCLKQLVASLSPRTPRSASLLVHVGLLVWQGGTGTGFSLSTLVFTCWYHSTNVL